MEIAARPLLEAHDIYRFYHVGDDETLALRGVSMTVAAGEMVAVMGPSGSGKSTLLSCLAGLDEPDGGVVVVAGRRMSRRSESERASIRAQLMGVLLQSGNLIDHLSIADNVRLQLHLAGRRVDDRIATLLRAVGIEARANARADQLSGGEAARAGLAIALAADPPVLLADEPTGEVDLTTEAAILDLLRERVADGKAALIATHSEVIAARADRVIRLRDGRIEHA